MKGATGLRTIPKGKPTPVAQWRRSTSTRGEWRMQLVSGVVEVCLWDGRIQPILWPYLDGFRGQIAGEKCIDFEMPGVDLAKAKEIMHQRAQAFVHQIGSELGLWNPEVRLKVTEPIILWPRPKRRKN